MAKIDIVIPVLNDDRILSTIDSVRYFDDIHDVRLIIMAGSSSEQFLAQVRAALSSKDVLSTEPDTGIFDALNKGLDRCDAPIIGWLGSDDVFTGKVRASDVLNAAENSDGEVIVYSTQYHRDERITRRLSAKWSKPSLVKWGFHNPHFSTFLTQAVYRAERFPISPSRRNQFSDIAYFAKVLTAYKVALYDENCTYMAEGGSASGTMNSVKYNFQQRYRLYRENFGWLNGVVAPLANLAWKLSSVLYYKLKPSRCAMIWRQRSAANDGAVA